MKNISILIVDDQNNYGSRLSSYISNHDASPFTVSLNMMNASEITYHTAYDLIIITSSMLEDHREYLQDSLVIVLDEAGTLHNESDRFLYIYKYQSAETIYKFILETCMEHVGKSIISSGKGGDDLKVIGLFSPVRDEDSHIKVSSFLKELSLSGKLLYISMKQLYTGVKSYEEDLREKDQPEDQDDFSAFIYYLKQQKSNLGNRLMLMAQKVGEYDLILPCRLSSELYELSSEDWRKIKTVLATETSYRIFVMDFVDQIPHENTGCIIDELVIIGGGSRWEEKISMRFRDTLSRIDSLSDIEIRQEGRW